MLLALHEEQLEHFTESSFDTNGSNGDLGTLLTDNADEITSRLESNLNQRFVQLESKIEKISTAISERTELATTVDSSSLVPVELPEIDSDAIAKKIESLLANRLDSVEKRLAEVSDTMVEQHLTLESVAQSVENTPAASGSNNFKDELRIEIESTIETVTDSFTTKIEEKFAELDARVSQDSDENQGQAFGEQAVEITNNFNSKIEAMFADLGARVTQISQGINAHEVVSTDSGSDFSETAPEEPSTDSASHWHKQKAAMLSKYGIDPEYRPVMELPVPEASSISDSTSELGTPEEAARMSEDDAAEIASIKEKLNAKLREAEVEMSISRAQLSQKKAELESVQVELDRRASAIEEKYEAVAKAPKKRKGLLERLSLHLGKKKSDK